MLCCQIYLLLGQSWSLVACMAILCAHVGSFSISCESAKQCEWYKLVLVHVELATTNYIAT